MILDACAEGQTGPAARHLGRLGGCPERGENVNGELKPCPLCGGAAAVWYFSDAQGYGVECSTASCGMEVTGCDNEAHAIRMWNTRPVEDALRAIADSVPWEELRVLSVLAAHWAGNEADVANVWYSYATVKAWLQVHAPKEADRNA